MYTEEDKEKLINAKVICESFTKTGKLSTEEDSNSESDNDDSMYPPDVKSFELMKCMRLMIKNHVKNKLILCPMILKIIRIKILEKC